ncbi:DUF2703 domain-containing protein [Thiolapillus sp.]
MNRLEIEWKHLDKSGNTCIRCSDTGEALQQAIEKLSRECRSSGWEIEFRETKLSVHEIAESNMILFNGRAIEDILPKAKASESHCPSCGEFTGDSSTSCRTVKLGVDTYEGIPSSLIRQAACEIAQCC